MNTVLYVNHKKSNCGVYEFGLAIGNVLKKSLKYQISYIECDSFKDFYIEVEKVKPQIIVYNYHPLTLKWVTEKRFFKYYKLYDIKAIHISTIHEVYQELADASTNIVFDYFIAADPTLLKKNKLVYKTGRLVPKFTPPHKNISDTPTFGSFGFATGGKGFGKMVNSVQSEYDEAIININISFSKYIDPEGKNAKQIARELQELIYKPKIQLKITHEHFSVNELQNFLYKNDMNLFLYDYQERRGISSTIDWALSVQVPIAITKSSMFRNIFEAYPSICIEDNSIKKILENGFGGNLKYVVEWSEKNLLWEYENMFFDILNFKKKDETYLKLAKGIKRRLLNNKENNLNNLWLKIEDNNIFDGYTNDTYIPIDKKKILFNRLLDNHCRELYKPAIDYLISCCPEVSKKKIPEANVQQAFVFDSIYRLVNDNKNKARILSVGSFEDTALLALQKNGFLVEGIDPVINYDIQTFMSKPNKVTSEFDFIFSTSVIEHVEDDENFIVNICKLLKVGGIAVLTCDFNDTYKKGDEIPSVDFRFYTIYDLAIRLLSQIPNCKLIDSPNWEADSYDFNLVNKYNYSFATFVFKKLEI